MQGTHTVFQEVQQAISNIFDVFQIHIYYRVAEIISFLYIRFLEIRVSCKWFIIRYYRHVLY